MATLLPWKSYVNAIGIGLLAAMVTAIAVILVPIPSAPDWVVGAAFVVGAVGYGLAERARSTTSTAAT